MSLSSLSHRCRPKVPVEMMSTVLYLRKVFVELRHVFLMKLSHTYFWQKPTISGDIELGPASLICVEQDGHS